MTTKRERKCTVCLVEGRTLSDIARELRTTRDRLRYWLSKGVDTIEGLRRTIEQRELVAMSPNGCHGSHESAYMVEGKLLSEISRECGIAVHTLSARYRQGARTLKDITVPPHKFFYKRCMTPAETADGILFRDDEATDEELCAAWGLPPRQYIEEFETEE